MRLQHANQLRCMCLDILILDNGSLKSSLMACQWMDFMAQIYHGNWRALHHHAAY